MVSIKRAGTTYPHSVLKDLPKMNNLNLHCLVTQSGSQYIAHCLDFDLVTAADSHHEALRRLMVVVGVHKKTATDQNIPTILEHKAPDSYWSRFNAMLESNGATPMAPGSHVMVVTATNAIH